MRQGRDARSPNSHHMTVNLASNLGQARAIWLMMGGGSCSFSSPVEHLVEAQGVLGSIPRRDTMDANRIEDRWRQLEKAGYDLSAIWREIQHEFGPDADKYLEMKTDELMQEIEKSLGT